MLQCTTAGKSRIQPEGAAQGDRVMGFYLDVLVRRHPRGEAKRRSVQTQRTLVGKPHRFEMGDRPADFPRAAAARC